MQTTEGTTTTSISTDVEYLKKFADTGANVIIRSASDIDQLTDDQFNALNEEHKLTVVEAKNLATAANFVESLHLIINDRVSFDESEKLTANAALYKLIQRIYVVYAKFYQEATKTAKQTITETLISELTDRGIKFKPEARCLTLCVALVFGDTDRRSEKYASVIVKAIAAKVQPPDLADWLTTKGGVENVLAVKPKAAPEITSEEVAKAVTTEQGRVLFRAMHPYAVVDLPHVKGEVALMLGIKNETGQMALVSTLDELSFEKCPPIKFYLTQVVRRKLAANVKAAKKKATDDHEEDSTEEA